MYDLHRANTALIEFIDLLNNWYIRRSRRRFWKSENDLDKEQAYQTLYTVLMKYITLACPVIPFITEEIYQNLKNENMPDSIHLCDYPVADEKLRDIVLEKKMEVTRNAVSMGRALRSNFSLKIRQPLKAIYLVTRDPEEKTILKEMEGIIAEELNVKEVVLRDNEEELVEYQAKANFRVLGKLLGKSMKKGAEKIEGLSMEEIKSLLDGATLSIEIDGSSYDITEESIVVQRSEKANLKVLNEGSLTIALDTEITDSLRQEGIVRDLVRNIQSLRKETGLDVADRINLWISGAEEIKTSIVNNEEYMKSETLAVEWEWKEKEGSADFDCGDYSCKIALAKI